MSKSVSVNNGEHVQRRPVLSLPVFKLVVLGSTATGRGLLMAAYMGALWVSAVTRWLSFVGVKVVPETAATCSKATTRKLPPQRSHEPGDDLPTGPLLTSAPTTTY